ncbi:protein of uncharacterised function (DUF1707) [Mycobacteroides abscessus subsp. massiliense]|nr:protein of uncharacterised function (DUF1707) [Mycobacteroides abscessus subsp. massiliense]
MSNLPERVTASMRAADVDRMRVAQLLSDAAAQGRLELSEEQLSIPVDRVFQATSVSVC